jgi:lysophospholipase L1-like esterase
VIGSSTIAHWTSLEHDLAPRAVVRRGISGARLSQLAALVPALVTPHAPRAVVVYAGENDLAGVVGWPPRTPTEVLRAFRALCVRVHADAPTTPIYFVSIKPAVARRSRAAAFHAANELIEQACGEDARLRYIDATTPLLAADGQPLPGVFARDGIHLGSRGYRVLAEVLRAQLPP